MGKRAANWEDPLSEFWEIKKQHYFILLSKPGEPVEHMTSKLRLVYKNQRNAPLSVRLLCYTVLDTSGMITFMEFCIKSHRETRGGKKSDSKLEQNV